MNHIRELAGFVVDAEPTDLRSPAVALMKRNVLDSIACAVGALDGDLVTPARAHAEDFSSRPTATFVGGGRASVDQAAFFNTVLVRYPDLLDTYLTPGGLCHPADNFGAILAMAEHVDATGEEFLLALAIAYEIQCRFSAAVPVMARGMNHALQLAMSAAAGSARLLGLDAGATADAIAAATADNVSLAAVHSEPVSMWKGISPAITVMRAVYVTLLCGRGFTGPAALIDGPNGLQQLFGQQVYLRPADRALTAVHHTYLKQYCSLIHGQVVIDAALMLRQLHRVDASDIEHVRLEVFQGAYDFAGGGSYGSKGRPWTKEQADYNLKYLVAVALLDGAVGPGQLETPRIRRSDVQHLLTRVHVTAADDLTAAYPERTAARVSITLRDGSEFSREQDDFEGSPTRPMTWLRVVDKFNWLGEPFADDQLRSEIVDAVDSLEHIRVSELARLLGAVSPVPKEPRTRLRL
jgi:2-methylcitrate dehydratase